MTRWDPNGATRLQVAAFELFDEQGFDKTTIAEIADRAGFTPRTYFNHFVDKREVLFTLAVPYQEAVVKGIIEGPNLASPLDEVVHAIQQACEELFEGRREAALRRRRVVDQHAELVERELSKMAALTTAIASALRERGTDRETAQLTAGAANLVQQEAFLAWAEPSETRQLRALLSDALKALRSTVR